MQKFSTEYFNSIRKNDEVTTTIFGNKRGLKGTVIKPAQIQYPPFIRWVVEFEDGTVVYYDTKTKILDFNCTGDVSIKAAGNINIEADGNIALTGKNIYLN